MTQWWSCALIGCSLSLNGICVHSMGVHELFPLNHWHSCALNGCSGAQSLEGIQVHSQAFRGCSMLTQRCFACSFT